MYRDKQIEVGGDLEQVASNIIQKYELNISPSVVQFVKLYPYISKTVIATCKRTDHLLHHYSSADYVVVVSGDIWDQLDEKSKEVIVYSQLYKLNATYNEKRGEWNYKMLPYQIVHEHCSVKFGVDFLSRLRTLVASLFDLDPESQDKISI